MKSLTMQSFLLKNIENCDKLFQQFLAERYDTYREVMPSEDNMYDDLAFLSVYVEFFADYFSTALDTYTKNVCKLQRENCLNEAFVEDVYDEQLKRELTVLNEDSILNASCPKIEDFFNE